MAKKTLSNREKRYQYYKWNTKSKQPDKPIKTYDEWLQWQISRGRDPDRVIDLRTPMENHYSRLRFNRHRAQAKYRGIEFEFTWEGWHAWWLSHGIDRNQPSDERGANRLCMCRYEDRGPYSEDNVYLATMAQNNSDAFRYGTNRNRGRPKGSKNKPKD